MGLKQVEIFEFSILGCFSAFLASNMASQSSNRFDSRSPDSTSLMKRDKTGSS